MCLDMGNVSGYAWHIVSVLRDGLPEMTFEEKPEKEKSTGT